MECRAGATSTPTTLLLYWMKLCCSTTLHARLALLQHFCWLMYVTLVL